MTRTPFLLGCLLLVGCPRGSGPPTDGSSGTPTATVAAPGPAPAPGPGSDPSSANTAESPPVAPAPSVPKPGEITLAPGAYTSAPCGSRTYPRVARIAKGNSIELDEQVSPCPKGKTCVWSGVVTRKGSYVVEHPSEPGKPFRLVLTFDEAAASRGALAAPSHFEWYESRGDLTEPSDTCPYE